MSAKYMCQIMEVEFWEGAVFLTRKGNTREENRNHRGIHELPVVIQEPQN